MKVLSPYPPLGAEAVEAMAQIERAMTFKGLEAPYEVVYGEALRRAGDRLLIFILTMMPLAVAVGAASSFFHLHSTAAYAFIPLMVATMAATRVLRGPRPIDDDQRLRNALDVRKVLQRKERAAS